MTNEHVKVYIDGFNLYYGAVKGTPYKWLDLRKLCEMLLHPTDTLKAIQYYTAPVSARPSDLRAPVRQQIYLRALKTTPIISIHYGHFLSHPVWMPLASSLQPGVAVKYAEVMKTEEKGSDVNLATHLVHDAHNDAFTLAVVVFNDSDLVEPIRIVRQELRKRVGVFSPRKKKHPSIALMKNADFVKNIRQGLLRACQFPDSMADAIGGFHKPAEWSLLDTH